MISNVLSIAQSTKVPKPKLKSHHLNLMPSLLTNR